MRAAFISLAAVVLVACALFFLYGCNIPYGDGFRVGSVTKISQKGWFCKTWEGQAFIGGGNTGVMTPETWHFSVDDNEIAALLQKAQELQKPVKMHYKELRLTTPCSPDSNYRITKVEAL